MHFHDWLIREKISLVGNVRHYQQGKRLPASIILGIIVSIIVGFAFFVRQLLCSIIILIHPHQAQDTIQHTRCSLPIARCADTASFHWRVDDEDDNTLGTDENRWGGCSNETISHLSTSSRTILWKCLRVKLDKIFWPHSPHFIKMLLGHTSISHLVVLMLYTSTLQLLYY